jgi:hypothetical protein
MSRSGYVDDLDDEWSLIRWRGQVASAIRGGRGQKFLVDLVAALDAMPEKRLIASVLKNEDGEVCALGAALEHWGVPLAADEDEDDFDPDWTADKLDIADQLAREVAYQNDEVGWNETSEERWARIRQWAASHIKEVAP